MRKRAIAVIAFFVVAALALPALAETPTTHSVEDVVIGVDCGGVVYEGTGNGSFTVHDPEEGSRFTNQTTFHIVWEFVNTEDPTDGFTYIDTGVAQIRSEDGYEIHSVSGHTTARPGDGALAYGRWVRIDEGGNPIDWTNLGHATGCTIISDYEA